MYCFRCGTQNDDSSKFCWSCGLDLAAAPVRDQALDPTEMDLVQEQLKDEYEILEELGRGGMAIVFKAREKQLEREVAIKVLPFSLAFDKEFVERFQREARTAAKLEHPSIIPIYRVGRSGRIIFFVMKFLRGKPLSSVLAARGALPPDEIRLTLVQVARALAYAHKSGIVHRDIKPDNIMFDEHGLAVVTDFGIAKAVTGGKLTGTGMSIGTPHYMSPEQARAQVLDGRSDIYSLGVVAYQCLTGSVPFDGDDSFSIGYKHIMEELPTPPLEAPEQLALMEIIRKMMAKAPDDRFQSADELVQALEAAGGFAAVGLATAPTRAVASLSGVRIAGQATTPLPRLSASAGPVSLAPLAPIPVPVSPPPGRALAPPRSGAGATPLPEPKHRSVRAGIATLIVLVVGIVGVAGWIAEKQGLIDTRGLLGGLGFGRAASGDSLAVVPLDSLAQRLLADTAAQSVKLPPVAEAGPSSPGLATPSGSSGASTAPPAPPAQAPPSAPSLSQPASEPVAPGTPARLTLQGVPEGAQVTLNGMAFRGPAGDVPPGVYTLTVRAPGFAPFQRQLVVSPGAPLTVTVELEAAAQAAAEEEGREPCDAYGPAYNQDHLCFDTRPVPLASTYIPVPRNATVFPRQAILLLHVSRDGETLEARVYSGSNVAAFNDRAVAVARALRWNPAQKNGEPVEAWVQWPFQPVRR